MGPENLPQSVTYRLLKAIFRHAPAYIYGLEGFTFMKRVTTVCGDIAPEELGFTDMHEHIMFNGADMGAICRPAMPTDLPVKYEDKVSLENIGFLKRNFPLV